jgi:hypothetical protein
MAAIALSAAMGAGMLWQGHVAVAQEPSQEQRPSSQVERIVRGPEKELGAGKVWTWVKLDAAGKATAVGIDFTETALNDLPAGNPALDEKIGMCCTGPEYALELPIEATTQTPFQHAVVNWQPRGHEPVPIYGKPHFDFHFYMVSSAERTAITATGDDVAKCLKPVPAEQVPEGYICPPMAVPQMGAHWLSKAAPELAGGTFGETFIYGSYDGKVTFYEPMVSKAFLETRPNVNKPIDQPKAFAKPGLYPTTYRVQYTEATRTYTVALEGLTQR